MKLKPFHLTLALLFIPVLMTMAPDAALADNGTQLPWQTQLEALQTALSSGTARVICLIAIFIAGVALVFGEDLGHFAKRLLMIVIAAAFLLAGASFLNVFTPASALVI
jgi:type IV secretory pathway VirB2 component (pilin)